MSNDIKTLKKRIKSVDSTLHLTKAMQLVAASKIWRANDAMAKSRSYMDAFEHVIENLSSNKECRKSPYLADSPGEKVKMIVIAGDRGLAGGYNANVYKLAGKYPDSEIIPIGKRANDKYAKSSEPVYAEHFTAGQSAKLAKSLCDEYLEGKIDKLTIICTKYVSAMTQEPCFKQILPIEVNEKTSDSSIIFEPDELNVLNTVVPEYVAGFISACVKESFACEVAARRMAMDSAGKNAKQMIDDLKIAYNRARQSSITKEITEIVAGNSD
ncbi:MAG: ATP synthase F1 subunit gamma [Clostridia bacterium]|nr:ATP synthase F1 subunit gamma [Clostridia bacterium]